jgi:hypothetical protein
MKTFRQFVRENFVKYPHRPGYSPNGTDGKLRGVSFKEKMKVGDLNVSVDFDRQTGGPDLKKNRKAYNANFTVNNEFDSPKHRARMGALMGYNRNPAMRAELEKIQQAAPEILQNVKKSIEKFIAEKKPKTVKLTPNEPHKEPLYRAYATYLARKFGGVVEATYSEFWQCNEFTIHFGKGR